MQKLDSNKPSSKVSQNICVVLPLPHPPSAWSMINWYWRKICGIPFLLRNIFNLQRSGVESIIIYSDTENVGLYKNICKENKITAKVTLETNVKKVIRATENFPTLILNG